MKPQKTESKAQELIRRLGERSEFARSVKRCFSDVSFYDELAQYIKQSSVKNDLSCEPWPVKDVLGKLVEAANILLNDHDYDGHGWEEINVARDKAIEIIERAQP